MFVFVGLLNVTPAIPGWDQLFKVATGDANFKIRRFPTEWLYPILFIWMMVIVALTHSIWRTWRDQSVLQRRLGLLLDVALCFMDGMRSTMSDLLPQRLAKYVVSLRDTPYTEDELAWATHQ